MSIPFSPVSPGQLPFISHSGQEVHPIALVSLEVTSYQTGL